MRPLFGIAAILVFAWVLSEERWRVPWRVVAAGVLLQFALALVFLKFPLTFTPLPCRRGREPLGAP
jgi:nucleoside permease NupC